MKQIILILSVGILSFGSGMAQKEYTKNLDAFVGIWEYKTKNELFRIVFIKGINDKTSLYDCVIGGYLYIKNGDTIGDYTKNIPVRVGSNTKDITILGTNSAYDSTHLNPNRIRLTFTDRKIGKTTWGFPRNNFTLLSPTEASFKVFNNEGMDGEETPPEEFSVPVDVIMKKVK
jgi:hypothetical protein